MTFWQPFWILAAILDFKENNFSKNRFLGIVNIHFDLFYCFLRHLQAKICKFPEFGGHLGKMANRKKCSTFGVWLQTDLDSAAQNLMETIIKVYICLKTRFSYQRLGSIRHQQYSKEMGKWRPIEYFDSKNKNVLGCCYFHSSTVNFLHIQVVHRCGHTVHWRVNFSLSWCQKK